MNTVPDAPLRYPLSLALFDYAPVALTPAALWLLVAALPEAFGDARGWALAGLAMMFAGGFCKATWKTIIAATRRDIRWLEHALFPLLAPGAALVAWATWLAAHRVLHPAAAGAGTASVAAPLMVSALLLAVSLPRLPKSRKWFLPLVALLTVATGFIAVYAALIARHFGDLPAAALFLAGFGVSLVTAALSRRVATIAAQWVMEAANTAAGALFLLAALRLGATLQTTGGT
jgi:uncharacterized membrane protein (UPF0136 family)